MELQKHFKFYTPEEARKEIGSCSEGFILLLSGKPRFDSKYDKLYTELPSNTICTVLLSEEHRKLFSAVRLPQIQYWYGGEYINKFVGSNQRELASFIENYTV